MIKGQTELTQLNTSGTKRTQLLWL